MSDTSKRIAALNDALRHEPATGTNGRVMITAGVGAHGPEFVARALVAVAAFDRFTADNDPYGEHDFGAFELDHERLFFKLDYFEKGSGYSAGAETPENPDTTERVLTIMLADEY